MKNNKGFTIMEMMMVIAIIGIMSAIGGPSFLEWRNNSNLSGAALTLKGDLEWAKSLAMRNNADIDVTFDAASSSYSISIPTIPDKIRRLNGITVTGAGMITFNNRKTAPVNNGTVTFTGTSSSRNISVNRIGRVSIN